MLTITVEHETDTAHRLSCHQGKCANLHGHRYKFVVSIDVQGTIEDDDKFMDFYELKSRIRRALDKAFDHGTILCTNEANKSLFNVMERLGQKTFLMKKEPTVEAMIPEVLKLLIDWEGLKNIRALTIYETPTNYCTWTKEEK